MSPLFQPLCPGPPAFPGSRWLAVGTSLTHAGELLGVELHDDLTLDPIDRDALLAFIEQAPVVHQIPVVEVGANAIAAPLRAYR